jgi:hypothetical protein
LSFIIFPNLVVNFSKIGILERILIANWFIILVFFLDNTIVINSRIISNLEKGSVGC